MPVHSEKMPANPQFIKKQYIKTRITCCRSSWHPIFVLFLFCFVLSYLRFLPVRI